MIEINMKWIVRLVLFLYVCYKAAYGAIQEPGLSVEEINYGENGYLQVGTRKTISCKGFSRNQKLQWVDPFGNVIPRGPSNRVFAQEHFLASSKNGRIPGLVLTLNQLQTSDSGVYQCRSGKVNQEVPVCVLEPATFIDPKIEVTALAGRAITLSCQAKGDPEPSLVWTANGNELSDTDDYGKYKISMKYNTQGLEGLLTILSLEPSDSKVYTCTSMQVTPMMDNCTYTNVLNVTLTVSHEPIFEVSNDPEIIYGREGEVVDLVCSASGYPLPTYRWFKDMGKTWFEFEEKQISYSEIENQANLSVTAGPTTFGQRYRCKATNKYGESDKQFSLQKIVKPSVAEELNFMDSSDSEIEFNITYSDGDTFPIEGIEIQYTKSPPKPGKTPKWINVDPESMDAGEVNLEGNVVKIKQLDADTLYWVRVRAINSEGVAQWSLATPFHTSEMKSVKEEDEEEQEEETKPGEESQVSKGSNGTFYGIFFAGGIFIVGAICMFAMRLV